MAMTEEERRAARNAASKRWYQKHKEAKSAMNRLGDAKPKKTINRGKRKINVEDKADEPEEEEIVSPVIAVDPAMLTGIEAGNVTESDIRPNKFDSSKAAYDSDEDDVDAQEARFRELREIDPDDMTDSEVEEFNALKRDFDEDDYDDWDSGRADIESELEKQGAYEDYE